MSTGILPRRGPRPIPQEATRRGLLDRPGGVPLPVWLLLLGLAADVFNGSSGYLGLPLSPDRVLIPLALLLMACDGRRKTHLRWTHLHTIMAVLLAWAFASMAWYGNITDEVAWYGFVDRLLMPFVLYVTAPWFFDETRHRDLLLATLTAIGAYLGITAVLEMTAPSLVFPGYITQESIGIQFGRARGPFVASETMGLACAVCAFAAGLFALRRRGHLRWVAAAVALLGFFGTALSLTRSTWVGAAAGILALALLAGAVRAWIPAAIGACGLAGTAVFLLLPQVSELFLGRFGEQDSLDDRLGSNDAALALLADRPLTGIGWRRFYPHGAEWFRLADDYPMNNVVIEIHNVLLSRAAELGIPAAILLAALWLLGPMRTAFTHAAGDLEAWRLLSAATFTAWLVTGVFGPVAMPFPTYAVWLIAGVAGQRFLSHARSAPPPARGTTIRRVSGGRR